MVQQFPRLKRIKGDLIRPYPVIPGGRYPLICSMPCDASSPEISGVMAVDGLFYQWYIKTPVWGE